MDRSSSSRGVGGSRPISAKAERARCTTESASPDDLAPKASSLAEVPQVVVRSELDGPLDHPPHPVQVASASGFAGAQVE